MFSDRHLCCRPIKFCGVWRFFRLKYAAIWPDTECLSESVQTGISK
ncbi:hypothetical protein HMPREF9370_0803 [Neisseria wadsworthii 9715]|uniref:Uncharacterized protein n=1 Tax=Neisseria wadsworthii 9715 TaxID=1030841 RepID=G4CNZ4_9NEIS|nr:hypothetical protein HMPREF9370_0803 [Neisseria wadsworthii 9715]